MTLLCVRNLTRFHLTKGPMDPQTQPRKIFSDPECRVGINSWSLKKSPYFLLMCAVSTVMIDGTRETPGTFLYLQNSKRKGFHIPWHPFYGFFTSQTLGKRRVRAEASRLLESQIKKSHSIISTAFCQSKQVTRPVQVQGVGKYMYSLKGALQGYGELLHPCLQEIYHIIETGNDKNIHFHLT